MSGDRSDDRATAAWSRRDFLGVGASVALIGSCENGSASDDRPVDAAVDDAARREDARVGTEADARVGSDAGTPFTFVDPIPGFEERYTIASRAIDQISDTRGAVKLTGYWAARWYDSGDPNLVARANAALDNYVSAVESFFPDGIINIEDTNPPTPGYWERGFGQFHWMACYAMHRPRIDPSLLTRFRDVVTRWNTTVGIDPLNRGGFTPNQKWMCAAAGVLIGEAWPEHPDTHGHLTRYRYLVDLWLPTFMEHEWKKGHQEYNSTNYFDINFACYAVLARHSTNPRVQGMARFLYDQTCFSLAHNFAIQQYGACCHRNYVNFQGTPKYSQNYELHGWALFGGETPESMEEPTRHFRSSDGAANTMLHFASGFNVPAQAWRINQALRQVPEHTFIERARGDWREEDFFPSNVLPSVATHTRGGVFMVSTKHYPDDYNVDQSTQNARRPGVGQAFGGIVTWKSEGSSLSMFHVESDGGTSTSGPSRPIYTHRSTCFGADGVIVQVFRLDDTAEGPDLLGYIEGFEPDQIQAESEQGSWKFWHVGSCLIACHFVKGFAIQPPKDVHTDYRDSHDLAFVKPWYRSPATGTSNRNGVVVETALPSDYGTVSPAAQLAAFENAVTADRGGFVGGVDAGQIDAETPRLTYHALNGKTYSVEHWGAKQIDGVPYDFGSTKRMQGQWISQDFDGNDLTVTDPQSGARTRYRWSDLSVTEL